MLRQDMPSNLDPVAISGLKSHRFAEVVLAQISSRAAGYCDKPPPPVS